MDVTADDHGSSVWAPLGRLLARLGVDVRTGTPVDRLERTAAGWRAVASGGSTVDAEHAVARGRPGRAAPARRPPRTGCRRRCATGVAGLTVSAPYAVARFWTDRPVRADRPVFSGVSREPTLDSITVYSRLEDGARQWAGRTGGEVIELHAYAADGRADRGGRGESHVDGAGRALAGGGRAAGAAPGDPGRARRARLPAGLGRQPARGAHRRPDAAAGRRLGPAPVRLGADGAGGDHRRAGRERRPGPGRRPGRAGHHGPPARRCCAR